MSAPYHRYAALEHPEAPLDPPERFHYRGCPAGEDALHDCTCYDDDVKDIKADFYSKEDSW